MLAVISIIGTSLLTSIFIEKNRKNIDYTELIANDIFASPEFYSNLTDENKEKMNKYLEEYIYHKSPIKSEIYKKCRDKIYNNELPYYYEELNMTVSYFQFDTYSEKIINRVVKVRSYDKEIIEDKLFLFSYNLSPTIDVKNFEITSAGIGNNPKNLVIGDEVVIEKETTSDLLWDKCGYTETYRVFLNKKITINTYEDLIINIKYISRVTDEDTSVGFGVFVPCKRFHLNFSAPENFIVYAHPHCFLNAGNNYPNSAFKNNISVHFDNWLLPDEGVVLCIEKSKQLDVYEEIAASKTNE